MKRVGVCNRCNKVALVWIQKGKDWGYCEKCVRDIAKEELAKLKR